MLRARLLPDRGAEVEAALYAAGVLSTVVRAVLALVLTGRGYAPSLDAASVAAVVLGAVFSVALAPIALARHARPDLTNRLVLGGLVLTALATLVTAVLAPTLTRGSALAAFVLFAVAVRRCPTRVAVTAGGLALIVFVVQTSAQTGWFAGALYDALTGGAGGVPIVTVLVALGWVIALFVGLLLRSADARRRADALARVRTGERLLVARELHDLVARHVTGMVVRAQAVGAVVPDLPETARSALADIEGSGGDALDAMRRMVGVLRDVERGGHGDLADLGDPPTSAADVEGAIRGALDGGSAGPDVRVDVDPALGAGAPLPRELVTTVHRLVAEARTNVARHAPAASLMEITARREDGGLVVTARNDGAAGGPRAGLRRGGFGLVGMDERVRALGGTLDCAAEGPDHWVTTARLPL